MDQEGKEDKWLPRIHAGRLPGSVRGENKITVSKATGCIAQVPLTRFTALANVAQGETKWMT